MDAQEALNKWDSGEIVNVIEMGGMGPGYEQCIQILMFEMVREYLKDPRPLLKPRSGGYPNPTDDEKATLEWWKALTDRVGHEADKRLDLGLSGAQFGAASNEAYNFLSHDSWEDAVKTIPDDRRIMVSNHWPRAK